MRALLAILVVAVAGGAVWLLTKDDPVTPALPEVPEEKPVGGAEQRPALEPYLEPMGAAPQAPAPASGLTDAERRTLAEGSHAAVVALVMHHGYTDAVVQALVARAKRLRAVKGDAGLRELLSLLAESNHALADAHLVTLLGDATFHLEEGARLPVTTSAKLGDFFEEALQVSEVEGIAEAALLRVHAAAQSLSVNSLDGWSELVVQHGTDHQIWQLMRSGYARSPGIYNATMEHDVDRAQRFYDIAFAEARAGTNGMTMDAYVVLLQRFAKYHHDVALPIIRDGLLTGAIDGQPLSDLNVRQLAEVYGRSEAIIDLPAAVAFLARIDDGRRRMNAMAMLTHMYSLRATDLPRLRPLVDQLMVELGAATQRTSIDLATDPQLARAMWVVETVHALRSETTLGAYRRAAKLITGAPGERARSLGERLSGHGLTEGG